MHKKSLSHFWERDKSFDFSGAAGGQGLINEEAQSRVQQTLGQSEGNIEHQQAVKQSILRGHMGHAAQNRLVHPHNGVQGRLYSTT